MIRLSCSRLVFIDDALHRSFMVNIRILLMSLITFFAHLNGMLDHEKVGISSPKKVQHICERIFQNLYEFNYHCVAGGRNGSFPPKISGQQQYIRDDYDEDKDYRGGVAINLDDMYDLLVAAIDVYEKNIKDHRSNWVSRDWDIDDLAMGTSMYAHAKVFDPDVRVVVMGDYHGCAHSLARNIHYMMYDNLLKERLINEFGYLQSNVRVVFLGDLADRGHYGIETWALALALKLQNPSQVVLVQGNHEGGDLHEIYGLNAEIASKFACDDDMKRFILVTRLFPQLFCMLPQVFFFGVRDIARGFVSYVLCCHGGLALCPNNDAIFEQTDQDVDQGQPGDFSIGSYSSLSFEELLQNASANTLCEDTYDMFPMDASDSGFIWDGFIAFRPPQDGTFLVRGERGCDWLVNGKLVLEYLNLLGRDKKFRVVGVIRGHDHLDNGVNALDADFLQELKVDGIYGWKMLSQPKILQGEITDGTYPVIVVTSVPEIFHKDAYVIACFDEEINNWKVIPHVRDVSNEPFAACWKTLPLWSHDSLEKKEVSFVQQDTVFIDNDKTLNDGKAFDPSFLLDLIFNNGKD